MIEQSLSFVLPKPWNGETFNLERFGEVTFLVGPNGSGKSRFADTLRKSLPKARLLGTDRLQNTGASTGLGLWGDNLSQGFQKGLFKSFKTAGTNYGSGIDTYVLLEERPDLRIIVEATLTNLFGREISLDWDSGNLLPRVTSARTGDTYRLDRDECHGIRELLVLLTHLYNDEYPYLIIDEPELNLHPQFQSFFMQEVRKIAGKPVPGTRQKGVFLITHSPFMLDLRSMDDLYSVFSFSTEHTLPRFVSSLDETAAYRLTTLIPRLNVHHKQLFFSDNPIFVEGILDAQIVQTIQERRNVSVTAAGSCIIDVGGSEEVTKYVELCRHFQKSAYFLYDLDSLFIGTLRQCIRDDGTVAAFLATLGLGASFATYCGELDRKLTDAIRSVRAGTNSLLVDLRSYIEGLADADGQLRDKKLARARVAVLVDLIGRRQQLIPTISEALATDIEGRLNRIAEVLRSKQVFLLPGGTLEHYLPSYSGNRYALDDTAKRTAVESEIALLSSGTLDDQLANRYGALFEAIARLPAKPAVDTDAVLLRHLSDYIHRLQGLVITHSQWNTDQFNAHFDADSGGFAKLFSLREFARGRDTEFSATIVVNGTEQRTVKVSHETNAGMRKVELPPRPRSTLASNALHDPPRVAGGAGEAAS